MEHLIGSRCEVYRNLHKNCFSIRVKGKVLGYADKLLLEDCVFFVQPGGRNRVLKTKRKNVHAGVRGRIVPNEDPKNITPLTYNPYQDETFVHKNTKEPIYKAHRVLLDNCKVYLVD